jgi:hypothetical protein
MADIQLNAEHFFSRFHAQKRTLAQNSNIMAD